MVARFITPKLVKKLQHQMPKPRLTLISSRMRQLLNCLIVMPFKQETYSGLLPFQA